MNLENNEMPEYIDVAEASEDGKEEADEKDVEENHAVAMALAQQDKDPEAKELDEIYMLEKQDPKHRMGNFLYALQLHYNRLNPKPRLPFFSWVDGLTVSTFKTALLSVDAFKNLWPNKPLPFWNGKLQEFQTQSVKYKSSDLIAKYRIDFTNGLVKRLGRIAGAEDVTKGRKPGQWINTGRLELYSTIAYHSHWSGGGWGIWVESLSQDFFSNRMKVGKFQHSSFLAGDKVAAAGEWQVENGIIKKITGRSGHYKPGLDHLKRALRDLRKKGVMLDKITVVLYEKGFYFTKEDKDKAAREVSASTLLTDPKLAFLYKVDPDAPN